MRLMGRDKPFLLLIVGRNFAFCLPALKGKGDRVSGGRVRILHSNAHSAVNGNRLPRNKGSGITYEKAGKRSNVLGSTDTHKRC